MAKSGDTGVDLGRVVALRPVAIDDMAAARQLHMSAISCLAAEFLSDGEIGALLDMICQPAYVADLVETQLWGAWLDNRLVGTGGWAPSSESRATARIRYLSVDPLFTRCGIGRRLLADAETRATAAGYEEFAIRSGMHMVAFYRNAGYAVTSHGVVATASHVGLPVTYLRKYVQDRKARSRDGRAAPANTTLGRDGTADSIHDLARRLTAANNH